MQLRNICSSVVYKDRNLLNPNNSKAVIKLNLEKKIVIKLKLIDLSYVYARNLALHPQRIICCFHQRKEDDCFQLIE